MANETTTYTAEDLTHFATYFKIDGVALTIKDGYVQVVLRDDENFMANCSSFKDWAFDYKKCRSEKIWEFYQLTSYGCSLWYKKPIIAPLPLRIKRPVMAPRTRNRAIGQEVFKEIVKMAYEMGKAQMIEDAAQKIKDEKKICERSLRDLIGRAEAFHITSCVTKIPRGPHTVLATGKIRDCRAMAELRMDSSTFTMRGQTCLHRLIIQKERDWKHVAGRFAIKETACLTIQDMVWNERYRAFENGDADLAYWYDNNKEFFNALYQAYNEYAKDMERGLLFPYVH